jgi:hypothetical protein
MLAGSMVGWISLDVLNIGQTEKRSAVFGPLTKQMYKRSRGHAQGLKRWIPAMSYCACANG